MADPVRVLHVDDDPEFAELTATFLERADDRMTVETATSAAEGRRRLAAAGTGSRPGVGIDCVVSDYDMPGTDGIEFLEHVRAEHGDLPFILFTGKGSEAVASDAIEAGVTHYIQKAPGTDRYALLANRITNAVEKRRAEHARRRHLDAIESAREGISILDEDGRFRYVNEAYADLYGYDPEELVGEHWELLYPDEDLDEINEDILPAVEETGHWHGTTTGLRADGTTFVEDHVVSATDEGGLICTVRDVSGREELTRSLRETRRRLELALEATDTGVWEWRPDDDEVIWNPTLERVMGLDPGEFEGTFDAFARRVHPDDIDEVTARAQRALREGGGYQAEFRMFHEDGSVRWVHARGQVVEDESGTRMVGVHQDITPRRKRERAIERLHRATRDLLGAEDREAAAGIAADAVRDILGHALNVVRLVDEAGERLEPVAATEDAQVEMGERPAYPVGDSPAGEAYRTGEPVVYEDVSTLDDGYDRGSARSVLYVPVGDHGVISVVDTEADAFDPPDVELARVLAANTAAAFDRLRREEEIRAAESRYRTLVEQFPDGGVFLFDEDLRYTTAGGRGLEAVGLTPADFEGATPHDLFPPELAEELATYYRRALAGETHTFEQQYEGNHYRIRTLPVRDDGDVVAGMAVSQDVTERRNYRARIEDLHRATRRLMAAETEGEVAERIVEAAESALGFPRTVVRFLEDDDRLVPAVISGARAELHEDRPVYEVGQPPVGLAFERGETLFYEHVEGIDDDIDRAPGDSLYVPIGDYGVLTVSGTEAGAFDESDVDVAEMLAANAEAALDRVARTRELRRQNDRLEEFAGVVSHDLRNPLNVVEGRIDLARAERDSEHLDIAAEALDRCRELVDDLLTLAREGDRIGDVEAVDLAAAVERAGRHLGRDGVAVAVETDRTIVADPGRLRQLLSNLLRNAAEHGSTDAGDGDADGVSVTVGDLPEGFYVADDGPGIPPEERETVFDAGHSTDADGLGVGLRIVEEVCDAHGWEVRVTESEAGGTRVEITGVETAE
ncbi:MAG: PAS domain S-box protein [Haloferacaceae archaeon]